MKMAKDKRITIRLNGIKLDQLKELIHEDDQSKAIDFAIDWTLHHIKFVSQALIGPEWDVIFTRKRKTHELKRKLYY